jgi:hypothetical protein
MTLQDDTVSAKKIAPAEKNSPLFHPLSQPVQLNYFTIK